MMLGVCLRDRSVIFKDMPEHNTKLQGNCKNMKNQKIYKISRFQTQNKKNPKKLRSQSNQDLNPFNVQFFVVFHICSFFGEVLGRFGGSVGRVSRWFGRGFGEVLGRCFGRFWEVLGRFWD